MEPMPRAFDPLSADWVAGVLLSCLLILATINLGSPRKWRMLRQAAFRLRLGRQVLRDETDAGDRNLLGLQAVAVVTLALLLWQGAVWLERSAAPTFISAVGIVALAMIGQAALLRLLAWLAKANEAVREYVFSGSLLYIALGIGLLPVVALIAYQPDWRGPLLGLGLLLLAASLGYRWLRALVIGAGEGVSFRYILLYLCAAEFLPLALALNALRSAPLN